MTRLGRYPFLLFFVQAGATARFCCENNQKSHAGFDKNAEILQLA